MATRGEARLPRRVRTSPRQGGASPEICLIEGQGSKSLLSSSRLSSPRCTFREFVLQHQHLDLSQAAGRSVTPEGRAIDEMTRHTLPTGLNDRARSSTIVDQVALWDTRPSRPDLDSRHGTRRSEGRTTQLGRIGHPQRWSEDMAVGTVSLHVS